jgi:hypothetical protein
MVNFSIIGHQMHNWESKFLQNEITRTQISFFTNFGGKLSFIMSLFFLGASIVVTYIFIVPTRTSIIITLKYCALNV